MAKPRPDEINLLDLWSLALTFPVGISIKTNDRKLLQAQLYRARQAEGTAEMQDLSIVWPAADEWLWIVKKEILNALVS